MSFLESDEEQEYGPRFGEVPKPSPYGLSNAPTTLALLGISLAKSMGFSVMWGGVAGAALGGVIMVLADQTHAHLHSHKY